MKTTKRNQISREVENWIDEDELPVRASLKVIRKFDDLYVEDEDERRAYWDFINWAINRSHEVILSIPVPENEPYFPHVQLDENGNDISPYNTMDFHRHYPIQLKKEHYAVKKVYERVKDLAQTYSVLNNKDGKKNIFERFKILVEKAFRDRAVAIKKRIEKDCSELNRLKALKDITTLNQRIRKCKDIWREHAYEG